MTSDALWGGILWGNRMTQFIYTDEAGHEQSSPLTVIAGVLVDADAQLLQAERSIEEVLRSIPKHLAGLGPISLKELYNNSCYRDGWSTASRRNMVLNLVSLARKCRIPVAFAIVHRGAIPKPSWFTKGQADFDHFRALATFAGRVDLTIRAHRPANEVGMLVYEDMDRHRDMLNAALNFFREHPVHYLEENLNMTTEERSLGHFVQDGFMSVERIRRRILFLKKGDDPLLLLADAAAFSVRRYFCELEGGDDLIEALLGYKPNRADFASGSARVATFG